jgi:hypothetical protein
MSMSKETGKSLLAIAASARHQAAVANTVQRFGDAFDKWIFVWDDSPFDDPMFVDCRIERRRRYRKWDFARELLTPDACDPYDLLFFWDDDLEISNFSPALFVELMVRNQLEMAQPALTPTSYCSHPITLQQLGLGRLTDFVEIMAPVYTRAAWQKWYAMMTPENQWGWGYDLAARSACGYQRMGIVDCLPVSHFQPVNDEPTRPDELTRFFAANPHYESARGLVFGPLIY